MDMVCGKMQLAVEYGVDVAIMLHNMVYWTEKNIANDKNYRNGRYWTYNSMDALSRIYPLWSRDQIKRILRKCCDAGLLYVDELNDDRRDRTKWYSPSDSVLALYGIEIDSIWRNRQMHLAKSPRADGEIATPLPSSIQQDNIIPPKAPQGGRKRKAPKSIPDHEPERFEKFWACYPAARRKDRPKAVEEWDRLRASPELLDEIARGLKILLASEDWRNGIGIPYPCRFLRNRRWEDAAAVQEAPRQPAPDGYVYDPEVY